MGYIASTLGQVEPSLVGKQEGILLEELMS